MSATKHLLLCLALAAGCDQGTDGLPNEDVEADAAAAEDTQSDGTGELDDGFETDTPGHDTEEPDEGSDPAHPLLTDSNAMAAASTDPWLTWVLFAKPGQGKFVSVDPATGVATTRVTTLDYGADWLPLGIAGNRVLWQNQSTELMSLWRIDGNGALLSYRTYQPPAGWKAKGITLDQEGDCPLPPESWRSYTVLFERPAGTFSPRSPALWHLDDDGDVAAEEFLPTSYSYTEFRDFRYSPQGYGALIHKASFAFVGDGSTIDWFGRNANGYLERLRTDYYSAANGNAGCTSRHPSAACFTDLADAAPGAGHQLTSMVTTQRASGSYLPSSYLLWSKTDGTATNLRLDTGAYNGKLYSPAAQISTTNAGFTAVSQTGAAYPFCLGPIDPGAEPWPLMGPAIDTDTCVYCD